MLRAVLHRSPGDVARNADEKNGQIRLTRTQELNITDLLEIFLKEQLHHVLCSDAFDVSKIGLPYSGPI